MNTFLRAFCTAFLSASLFVGCSSKNEVPVELRKGAANPHAPVPIRDMADLRRLLVAGMGTNQIVAVFGEPRWTEDLGKGEQVWHYGFPAFPADNEMRGSCVVGVAIGITNGLLAIWGCSHVGVPSDHRVPQQQVLPSDTGQADPHEQLKVFIVSSDPTANGQFIDTERFPKVGFIPRTPNLAIHKVKEVTLDERAFSESEGQNRTIWSFSIFLNEEDATRLKTLTETNVSRQIVIMIRDEPVSAPRIRAPLENGVLQIECSERSVMELLKKLFASMEQQDH
jgi:hypothetical protein